MSSDGSGGDGEHGGDRVGGLPATWPSAWPSLRSQVLVLCIVPVVAALVCALVLLVVGILPAVWWLPLLPLLFLAGPLSLPGRVRRSVQRTADASALEVRVAPLGLLVRVPRARWGLRPSAEVPTRGPVRYST